MISIQGISCSAGIMPMLACLPIILLTEMKSLSGSLSMVIGGGGRRRRREGKARLLLVLIATNLCWEGRGREKIEGIVS